MQELTKTLDELEALHRRLFGRAAPEVAPHAFIPFPPGVDPIEHARAEVRHLEHLAERVAFAPQPDAWVPPTDSFVGDETFTVHVEVPGVSREDLKVHVLGRECIVRGERKPPQGAKDMRPMSLERPWGCFERRFILPTGCKVDEMKARCVNGVLELVVPMESAALPKEQTIEVD